jgi:hypothetical protein
MTLFLSTIKYRSQFTMNTIFEDLLIGYPLDDQQEIQCKNYEAKFTNKDGLFHVLIHQVYFSRNSYYIVV